MKVSAIEINNFLNFESDFKLDLTYPVGHHTKAGKPLDKICIIGQSGTGKTVLLNLIKFFSADKISDKQLDFRKINDNVNIKFKIDTVADGTEISKKFVEGVFQYTSNGLLENEIKERWTTYQTALTRILIHYPYDLIRKREGQSELNSESNESKKKEEEIYLSDKVIDFEIRNIRENWRIMQELIEEHCIKENNLIRTKVEDMKKRPEDAIEKVSEIKNWENENANPLAECAEKYLNPILNEFQLEVVQDIDLHELGNRDFIKIKQIKGDEIPFDLLSTGTKHTLLFALSLFLLKPQNTIILFDEPERSLHPEMQVKFIEKILEMAPDCQFIFASHSPTIASIFEPWEVVHLEYNSDNGKTKRHFYYEEENKVDNYTIFPEYLKYENILRKVFGVEYQANYDVRAEALTDFARLKSELEVLKTKGRMKSPEYISLNSDFMKLAKRLGWEISNN